MICVFLDVDGVVAPYHPPFSTDENAKLIGPNGEKFYKVWPVCVEVLNTIADRHTCQFILNSTWKSHGDRAQNELEAAGFRHKIVDKTPSEGGEYTRSHAISGWFKQNGIDEDCVPWVAIDDEFFSYNPKHRSCHLLHTNAYTGLFQGNVIGFEKLLHEQKNHLMP